MLLYLYWLYFTFTKLFLNTMVKCDSCFTPFLNIIKIFYECVNVIRFNISFKKVYTVSFLNYISIIFFSADAYECKRLAWSQKYTAGLKQGWSYFLWVASPWHGMLHTDSASSHEASYLHGNASTSFLQCPCLFYLHSFFLSSSFKVSISDTPLSVCVVFAPLSSPWMFDILEREWLFTAMRPAP